MAAANRPLDITVTPRDGGVVVALRGSATMDRCGELNDRLVEAAAQAPPVLVIDLADLDFICSLGLGSLVAAHLRAKRHQGTLVLSAPGKDIANLLHVTKLNTLLPVYESVDAALGTA